VAFTPSGRVLTAGFRVIAPNTSTVLFDVGGVTVNGVCTASDLAQLTLGDHGGAGHFLNWDSDSLNWDSDSSTKGHLGGSVVDGSSTVILEAGVGGDRVSYEVQETGGLILGGTADGYFNAGSCVFQATGIAANAPAPPAGQGKVGVGLRPRTQRP
jgi:hypothetical protein